RMLGFFFFQAEDGIRDFHVTGVQTCALPICRPRCGSTYSLAVNWNRTEVDAWDPDFIDEARVYKLEESLPKTKGYFSINHARDEIGRASWRERVWSSGVGHTCSKH